MFCFVFELGDFGLIVFGLDNLEELTFDSVINSFMAGVFHASKDYSKEEVAIALYNIFVFVFREDNL